MVDIFKWFSPAFNAMLGRNKVFENVISTTFGPSKVVVYNAKGKPIDVRETLRILGASKPFLEGALKEAGIKTVDSLDVKVEKIRDYVNKRLAYTRDIVNYGMSEYWADAYTVYSKKADDCDGYAVLIMALMQLAGIPAWRRRVVAGTVATGEGHAYVVYFTEANNMWCVIEGSYYASDAKAKFNVVPYISNARYVDTWFCFNEEQAWSSEKKVFINDFLKLVD